MVVQQPQPLVSALGVAQNSQNPGAIYGSINLKLLGSQTRSTKKFQSSSRATHGIGAPNPPLHSDPACIVFRSLSTSRFLGFVQRLGAGGAGELLSLGRYATRQEKQAAPSQT